MVHESAESRDRADEVEGTDEIERASVGEGAEPVERAIEAESIVVSERAVGDEGTEAASERKIRKWERLWRRSSPEQVMLLRRESLLAGERVECVRGLLRATSFGPEVSGLGRAAGPENGSEGAAGGSEPTPARAPDPTSEPNDRRAPSSESEPTGERAPNDMSADFGEPE